MSEPRSSQSFKSHSPRVSPSLFFSKKTVRKELTSFCEIFHTYCDQVVHFSESEDFVDILFAARMITLALIDQ